MVFSFYLFLNILTVFLFLKFAKKNIHILEITVYWMLSTALFQNYSAINFMNFKTLMIPDAFNPEMSHLLNRIVLIPVVLVWFLNEYVAKTSFNRKFILFMFFVILGIGLEWLSDWLGVIIHVHWKFWWSLAFWVIALLAAIGFMRIFREQFLKGRPVE